MTMGIRQLIGTIAAFAAVNFTHAFHATNYEVGYINVSVATLWTDSSKPRPVDAPDLTSPVGIQKWLDTMTVDQFLDLTDSSRTQTQAIYGTQVYITDKSPGWYKILTTRQPNPSNDQGYPGWVPSCQVHTNDPVFATLQDHRPFALVTKAPTAPIFSNFLLSRKLMDISYSTRLPVVSHVGKTVMVAVPGGGFAYLPSDSVAIYHKAKDIPKPTGRDLVESGKKLIGRPYLWGGASGFAPDCSGFTHTIHDAHGVTIPRDSGPQAYMPGYGNMIEKDDLQAGDVVFYATNVSNAHTIHHVALYAGDGKMLEAYGAGVPVRLTDMRFGEEYFGARRFI